MFKKQIIKNKKDLIEILNQPMTTKLILSILSNYSKLPKKGILSGQSVASAIFELLQLNIKPIYNDIDIFIDFSLSFWINNHREENKNLWIKNLRKTINEKQDSKTTDWGNIFVEQTPYGQIQLSKLSTYKVLTSTKIGMLNKTYILSNFKDNSDNLYKSNELAMEIISNFDMNCVQVGINLETNKLFFTENFLEFLLTKQLKIVKWNTPIHSFIRLQKKFKELETVYTNFNEAYLIAATYSNVAKNISETYFEIDKIGIHSKEKINDFERILSYSKYNFESVFFKPLFFGEKHKKELNSFIHEDFIDKISFKSKGSKNSNEKEFFRTIQNESTEVQTLIFEDKRSEFLSNIKDSNFGKSSLFSSLSDQLDFLLYTTEKDNFFEKAKKDYDLNKQTSLSYKLDNISLLLELLPTTYDSTIQTRKKSIHFFENFFLNKSKENRANNSICMEIENTMFKNLNKFNINDFQKTDLMEKIFGGHSLYNSLSTLDIQYWPKLAKDLNWIEKNIENGNSIYGILEDDNIFIPEYFLKDRDLLIKILNKYLNYKKDPLKEKRSFNIDSKNLRLKELITPLELLSEGNEMSHCVGGYTGKVKVKQSYIFSCFYQKERFTIELFDHDYKKENSFDFELIQARGKRNCNVDWNKAKDILFKLNEKFNFFPINARTLESCFDISTEEANLLLEKGVVTAPENSKKRFVEINNNPIRQGVYRPPEIDINPENEIPF